MYIQNVYIEEVTIMKTQLKTYGQFIKIATLLVLALAFVIGWSQ